MSNQKKNIKIVTYGNFPFGGASANLLRYFSLSLVIENNDVEVIMPTGGYFGKKIDINKKRKGNIEKVKYRHTGFVQHPRNYLGKFLDIVIGIISMVFYILINHLIRKIDTIIVYNTTFSKTLLFLVIRAVLRVNVITILPEFYEKPKAGSFSLHRLKWNNYYWGMKYLIKYSDAFIVASYFLKNFIEKELCCNKDILVLPNVMDPTIFNQIKVDPFMKNIITIGYTGTPTRKDGVVDLIKSFSILNKKYPKTHLLIIGDITNGNTILDGLKKLASDLGISDNITFTGLIPFSEIPKLLNSCQILTLTRPNGIFAEAGFPTKLGEYFACNKPVVVTKVGDIGKYFINEKQVILVEPENIENIALGFEKLILSNELGHDISNNAYTWMDKNLNFRNISKNIDEFISQIKNQ